jgi:deoxyribonuclease-4
MDFNKVDIYDLKWDVGSHICFLKDIKTTIYFAIKNGMYTCQFFLGNPKSFIRTRVSDIDIINSKKIVDRYPINVFSHAPYLFNLAGSKDQLAWNGDEVQDKKTLHIIKELSYELSVMSNFKGVIIHPGNSINRKEGLKTIALSINKIDFTENSRLLLENSAGQGTSLATTFKEIFDIIDKVDSEKKKYIGVCIDTAHIFGYGEYDIRTIKGVKKMLNDFDELIGLDKFWLLHLNDSEVPFGSKKDRHALIGTGFIWKESNESLLYLLDRCKENKTPVCLETCPSDMKTILNLS